MFEFYDINLDRTLFYRQFLRSNSFKFPAWTYGTPTHLYISCFHTNHLLVSFLLTIARAHGDVERSDILIPIVHFNTNESTGLCILNFNSLSCR